MVTVRRVTVLGVVASVATPCAGISVSVQTSLRHGSHQLGGVGADEPGDNSTAARLRGWRQGLEAGFEREVGDLGILSFLFGVRQERGHLQDKALPKCGISQQVTARDDKQLRCPDECPVFAEQKGDGMHCNFGCVPATVAECQRMNPREPIPDLELGACRACMVSGCADCALDGTDTCTKCSQGYKLVDGGMCQSEFFWVWVAVFLCIGVVAAVIVAWIVSLALSPPVNLRSLRLGLAHRSRCKLMMPKGAEDATHTLHRHREPWPLLTNLCRTEVAGPGLHLQFNYQAALIIWALGIAVSWYVLVLMVDPELGSLGLHQGGTSRQNCIVVAHGWQAQRRLMPIKIKFVACVYIISFVMAIVFAVLQARRFNLADAEQVTHKDFCARCTGVPELTGEVELERELKDAVATAVSKEVVNVSVCWDFEDHEETLTKVLEDDMAAREEERRKRGRGDIAGSASEDDEQTAAVGEEEGEKRSCWAFRQAESLVFSDDQQDLLDNAMCAKTTGNQTDREFQKIRELLQKLQCTGQAFIVFRSEADRDEAVEKSEEAGGLAFRDSRIMLQAADCEPASVLWQNCVEKTLVWKLKRATVGFAIYILALSFWVSAFYAPYAYIMLSSNYNYGQQPSMVVNLSFTVVVVVGNALMYFTCSEIADRLGFESKDNREVLYTLLYTVACMMNVLLDMVVTYYMAYWMLVGVGFQTWNGKPLAEVHSFTERFETYAMQRSLGDNLWQYSFPSTFLVPFLIEPVATIYLPYKLMTWIVRSNKGIREWSAGRLLTPAPMDLSRYADLLVNAMLAVLIFYFPPGWTHYMFFAMAMSHCVVYALDHYKVLRCIPTCYFSSSDVDWWAQWMLSIPCGLILSSLVFKINSLGFGWRLHGYQLVIMCSAAALLHIAMHTWALFNVVPKFSRENKSSAQQQVKYRDCAKKHPWSWFASNPIYCLRSKYIYKQDPPCDYVIAGKEHLLRTNEREGYYFQDKEVPVESYDVDVKSWSGLKQSLRDSAGQLVENVREVFTPKAKDPEAMGPLPTDSEDTPVPTPRTEPGVAPPPPTQQATIDEAPSQEGSPTSAPAPAAAAAAAAAAVAAAAPTFQGPVAET